MTESDRARQRGVPAEVAVWVALVASLLLLGAVTFATYGSTSELTPVLEELDNTRRITEQTARFLSDFRESQSERRAYLLSGDDYFLKQHRATLNSARRQLRFLEGLVAHDTTHRRRVAQLQALVTRADSIGTMTILVRQTQGLEAAAAIVRSRAGHAAAQDVERAVRALEVVEQERLSLALDVARRRALIAQRIAIVSAALALLLLPAATIIIWKDLQARRLAARQLRHASREAEAATRAKSEFLASMSHEIRTPLNGVIGMTELALDTSLTATQRDYLQTARASAESLLRLLNDILDFSKIEAGRLDLETTSFSIRDLLGETLRTLALRAEQKQLELAFRVLPSVPDVLVGDPGRFQQVVVNLVGNAIKFTEKGEIVVLVESQQDSAPGITLRVSVRDTGIGIPRERTRAIFELFSQADSSTTRRFGGTGLGLTISEQLVKLMGGSIWVESEVGKGSTFFFTVRLDVGEQKLMPRATLEQIEGLRVLLLDDHPTNRLILEEMLTVWHMQPQCATTGAEAITMAERARREGAPFQVAILDYLLPDLDGYAVAERLAAAGVLPASQVIILSSDTQLGNAARRAAIGISRQLMKPAKQSELLDAILTAAVGTATVAPQQPAGGTRWDGARVLVVEDNLVNQRVAQGLLQRRGVSVTIAQNGAEAVDVLTGVGHSFGLVLMDVEMPVMDGLAATRKVRGHEASAGAPRVPIVAVTAHALAEERARCEAAGMDLCLTKPLRAQELDDVLARYLGADGEPGPAPAVAFEDSILDIVGGDRELLGAVAGEYLRQTPPLLRELSEAVERRDASEVRRTAHKLRGSSLQVGGARPGAAAGRLEDAARDGDLSAADTLLREITEGVEELTAALTAMIGETT